MKKITTCTILLYQLIVSAVLKNILGINKFCRYSPTCSEYAKLQIKEKGFLKGTALAISRISKCHPFARNI
jgi:putative membrane protein insertion efficiency factor